MTILDAPTRIIIPAMWLAWAALWMVAALYTKATRWRESIGSRARHVVPFLICFVLLAAPRSLPAVLTARVVAPGRLLPLLGALLVAAGLGLAVWARWHLGRNWSGVVTLKQDHALIRTGPHRAIRHPIYTGCCSHWSVRRRPSASGGVCWPSSARWQGSCGRFASRRSGCARPLPSTSNTAKGPRY